MIQINQSCLRAFHMRNRSLSTRKRHKKRKKYMDYKTSTKRIMISIVVFIFSFFSTVLDLARISQKEKEDLKKASYIKADRFLFTLTCITVRYFFFHYIFYASVSWRYRTIYKINIFRRSEHYQFDVVS